MAERKQLRSINEVWEDLLWPGGGIMGPDPEQSRRHKAVAEVLCCIPEEDYQKLSNELLDQFQWFIPHHEIRGMVYPFFADIFPEEDPETKLSLKPYAQVIYLSPVLEKSAYDIVVAIVAHEIAHIVLGHKIMVGAEYETQEQEAFDLICKWGFEKEAKKHHAGCKRRESLEETMVRKVLEPVTGKESVRLDKTSQKREPLDVPLKRVVDFKDQDVTIKRDNIDGPIKRSQ